jgi:hypothetical protein
MRSINFKRNLKTAERVKREIAAGVSILSPIEQEIIRMQQQMKLPESPLSVQRAIQQRDANDSEVLHMSLADEHVSNPMNFMDKKFG